MLKFKRLEKSVSALDLGSLRTLPDARFLSLGTCRDRFTIWKGQTLYAASAH